MSKDSKPRVKVPKTAAAGSSITIKTLISHKMESGQRKDKKTGELIPRSIINRFTCDFNGTSVIEVQMEPAISTNPYFQFDATVPEAGDFVFTWYDDTGSIYTTTKSVAIG
jgi:sulfur-oxidizing protein SoxZ